MRFEKLGYGTGFRSRRKEKSLVPSTNRYESSAGDETL